MLRVRSHDPALPPAPTTTTDSPPGSSAARLAGRAGAGRPRRRRRGRATAITALAASAALLIGAAGLWPAQAATDGAAVRPIMGWSSWSFYRGAAGQTKLLAQAKAMQASLEKYGYTYINIDAGWSSGYDKYGRPVPNTNLFPSGISGLAATLHSMGLKVGIYMNPGMPGSVYSANDPILGTSYHAKDIVTTGNGNTTGGSDKKIDYSKPGAQAYINSIVSLFASWGVDYVKMDFVGPGGGNVAADNRADIQAWNKAIVASGRAIVLELSNSLSFANAATWKQYANGWRIDGDIEDYADDHVTDTSYPLTSWAKVTTRFRDLPKWVPFAGSGGWNDLDSLELGNGANDGLTLAQRQSAMTLWSMSCAPLILGADLTHLDPTDLTMMTNSEVIAVNQNGHPAALIGGTATGATQVWAATESDGSHVVALFNLSTSSTATVRVTWKQLGITGAASVRDLWSHTNLGSMASGFSAALAPGASRMIRVSGA